MSDDVNDDRITGQVAHINSDRELVINRGLQHGVTEGMIFRIKGAPIEVIDPETGENIGNGLTHVKAHVKVTEIGTRFAIAQTFLSHRVNVGGVNSGANLGRILQPPKWETRTESLLTSTDDLEEVDDEDRRVRVGDIVQTTESDGPFGSTTIWAD
ncbi:MAG TPA: hypothetical protein VK059_14375 [Nocardioidaceae bacterium]|nr:hypothetical protein [Nocardioidaceae bacterium]